MFPRSVALAILLVLPCTIRAQVAVAPSEALLKSSPSAQAAPESAWLDLRQVESAHATMQAAPGWVESLSFVPAKKESGQPPKTVFRLRLTRPNEECQVLLFRLFFDDDAQKQPELVAWDESGSQLLRSGSLGQGTNLSTSSTTLVPMIGVSTIDVEVPGDGRSVRGAYLDWLRTSQVMHPIHAEPRDFMPAPFAAAAPLHTAPKDAELFGTMTARLAAETIAIGSDIEHGAGFQFDLEAQPLIALLTFEIASPQIDSPPQVYINGEDAGMASLSLPGLADPGYRGISKSLFDQMLFQYTGWVRAQIIVPPSRLKAGTNDVIIIAGAGTPVSAIRETQIELKYLWDKSDYLLEPLK